MGKELSTKTGGFQLAVKLLKKYLMKPTKADTLLSDLPDNISSTDRRYCQFLFFGSIRHKGLIDHVIKKLLQKPPRVGLRSLLMVGIYEIMERETEDYPKIVDFSVETAKDMLSSGEAKLVNAVLRKVPGELNQILNNEKFDSKEWLATRFSHPLWLVKRWSKEFGWEALQKILEWDLEPAQVYVRSATGEDLMGLEPTKIKDFYIVGLGQWRVVEKLIQEGRVYVQDPSTSIAPGLASVIGSDFVLDLCAAPGGKSMAMAEKLKGGSGQLVALDLPGERIVRLRENLANLSDVKYAIVEADLYDVSPEYLKSLNLPRQYDVVLLDAPCSNTGVLRRRVDAKWRLEESDIPKMAHVQLNLLKKAGSLVKPGGRLVYSTCSIENEENGDVISGFLKDMGKSFELAHGKVTYPWVDGCDGGGAFLLRRKN